MSEKWYRVDTSGSVAVVEVEKETSDYIYLKGKHYRELKYSDGYWWYDKDLKTAFEQSIMYREKIVAQAEQQFKHEKDRLVKLKEAEVKALERYNQHES